MRFRNRNDIRENERLTMTKMILSNVRKFGCMMVAGLAISLAPVSARADAGFKQWINQFYATAAKEGISKATYQKAFAGVSEPDPVVIICPEAPQDSRGPLAATDSRTLSRLHRYADVDALLEIFGHIRALNPQVHVLHRLPSTVRAAELSNHLVLLGGIGWNKFTGRILSQIERLPIKQIEHPDLTTGEVFKVEKAEGREEEIYFPTTEKIDGVEELIWDVALLARLPNPFNSGRTLTVCNGVHSRGVVGAVLTVTDETVRPANEEYLAERFPEGTFAMLIRVPVLSGEALAPDLQNSDTRLFEWQPGDPVSTGGSGA